MTSDMDDDNDTIKIEISKDNKYKRFFEKGLNALLSDPNFLLLYVPGNGTKMQVIRPASDPYHRRRMIRKVNGAEGIPSFYYALSHLWGISPDDRYHWNDISEYVNDEDGQPVRPVSMRPEKRDTLLALLKDHPDSYWWIDVLCARTDTPLDIMGNVYACCLECIAMIDCEPDLISQLHSMANFDLEHIEYHANDIETARQCIDQCHPLTDSMDTLLQSRWWYRVWTWQEMALPLGEVRLMAETGTHTPLNNTITVDELHRNGTGMLKLVIEIHSRYNFGPDKEENRRNKRPRKVRDVILRLSEVTSARAFNRHRLIKGITKGPYLVTLINSWRLSMRRCMNPVDYVYGVLGIFQFEIPRMEDPDAVWKLFLSKMDQFLGDPPDDVFAAYRISNDAYQFDLRKAQDMGHVYRGLLEFEIIRRSKQS